MPGNTQSLGFSSLSSTLLAAGPRRDDFGICALDVAFRDRHTVSRWLTEHGMLTIEALPQIGLPI